MDISEIYDLIDEFNKVSHGSSNYDQDSIYVLGKNPDLFAPLSYINKKLGGDLNKDGYEHLLGSGFIFNTYDFVEHSQLRSWYEKQFSKKTKLKTLRSINVLYRPNHKHIFDALETVNRCYETLRDEKILINNKNLPIQLGEWYAKCIFGLVQRKSSSQRGFDFVLKGKLIEVKVHWNDKSSPKGVKIKKSMVELANNCILIYISKNFMIRDICFLDSNFILRKFGGKGHTIFLKDPDIAPYFFSRSSKCFSEVVNKTALMTFASPALAMKLEGRL